MATSAKRMAGQKAETVLLYSTSLHCWEAWRQGRPLGHGSLRSCLEAFPDALRVEQRQLDAEAADPWSSLGSVASGLTS